MPDAVRAGSDGALSKDDAAQVVAEGVADVRGTSCRCEGFGRTEGLGAREGGEERG